MTDLEQFGPTGRLHNSIQTGIVGSGTTYFTGSLFGFGAVMVQTGFDGIVGVQNGNPISGSFLTAGVVYDFGIDYIEAGAAGSAFVFKLK